MAKKDYYELLGIQKGATEQEIKAAYKKMVMKYHPDRYATKGEQERKDAESIFKEINHAYDVLGDPTKKSNYDQFGSEEGIGAGGFGGSGGYSGGGFGGGGLDDIFGDIFNMFGGGGKRQRANMPVDGDDIVLQLNISFEEAIFGCKKEVKIYHKENCPDCKGSGAASSDAVKTCPQCKGSGRVVLTQRTVFGVQQVQTACPECGGSGKIITDKCKSCRGAGTTKIERTLTVTVPAGADDGQTISFYGQGDVGANGGRTGALIIQLGVKAHPLFKRKGIDLYITYPITFVEATVGAKVKIPTTTKPVVYSIPAGTQSGTLIKIKGYGVKHVNREYYGDLYVTVEIETPTKLSSKQEKLLEEFEDSLIDKQYDKKSSFNNKYLNKP